MRVNRAKWSDKEIQFFLDYALSSKLETPQEQITHARTKLYHENNHEFKERSINACELMYYRKTLTQRKTTINNRPWSNIERELLKMHVAEANTTNLERALTYAHKAIYVEENYPQVKYRPLIQILENKIL